VDPQKKKRKKKKKEAPEKKEKKRKKAPKRKKKKKVKGPRKNKKKKMLAYAEIVSSVALLVPAIFAATRARKDGFAATHATAIFLSAALSIVYWSTANRAALTWDRVAARVRIAVDLMAFALALTRNFRGSLLPLGIALLALAFYDTKSYVHSKDGDARLVSLLHTTFHILGSIGEIALIAVAYPV
jgi:hypothetical protein